MMFFSEYAEIFNDELGKLPGDIHLTIDKTVQPVAITSCRLPISQKGKVKQILDKMEKNNIVCKVDEPTDWVSRMVTATKSNGDIRVCIDPQMLNKALKREFHPMPVVDDVLPELSKAKVFSSFDLKNGYWQCSLDNESSLLTTFQTPWGRYRWLRLPFGLAVSSEIFQKRLQMALDGLDGVICIADDILVYGIGDNHEQAVKDHDIKLHKLLNRCSERGIRLNKAKTKLRKSEITFLGHKITSHGLMPDPLKVEAIVNMDPPTDVAGIQRLAGMVNYLAKFLPNLSEVMEPLRRLTRHDVEWKWTEDHNKAFSRIKKLISATPVLRYYDVNDELVIQCDASKKGLGTALMQSGKPIAYASRALTETETRYAQIEKEALAIVFSLEKFHQYTFGRKTIVESDHKPLEMIILKPLCRAPKRLQGMLMRILQYDVEIKHKKGSEMLLADTLSRAFLPYSGKLRVFDHINMVDFLPIRPEHLDVIQKETDKDEVMQLLKTMILDGWPDNVNEVPVALKIYYGIRDEFAIQNGLIFKGDRIVIPLELRNSIMESIHSSHCGVESCLRRARECVYWPCMNSDVKQFISKCETCNRFPVGQQKETLQPHELADRPWEKVGVDLMFVKNCNYLITVDYFSNFWEIDYLENTKANTVIRKLKAHFSRYGLPSILMSDNGPQFSSDEFKNFALKFDFEHKTSSPHYPRSNGMAESAVKTAKKLLVKAVESGRDPYLAILDYRNTPMQYSGFSPAQGSLGRRTRTLLPMVSSLLKPQQCDSSFIKTRKALRNSRSKWYHDRGAKDLEEMAEGDSVRIKPSILGKKQWNYGTVVEKLENRSYVVESDDGILRRNRVHLKKTNEVESPKKVKHESNIGTDSNKDLNNDISNQNVLKPVHNQSENEHSMSRERSIRNMMPNRFKDFIVTKQ